MIHKGHYPIKNKCKYLEFTFARALLSSAMKHVKLDSYFLSDGKKKTCQPINQTKEGDF